MSAFLNSEKPLLTAMVQYPTPEECILKIKASLAEGADALGIQLCKLRREFRTKEVLMEIFAACEGKPIYVTSYRVGHSEGLSDDEVADLLLLAADCGANLMDVMGDLYGPDPAYQLTTDPEAVERQKALIAEIHRRGGEVLMSCHTNRSTTVEENLMIARAQAERGADVIKIVNDSKDLAELPGYVESIRRILEETGKKLLFLAGGPCSILRYIGPSLGVCMYLCVQHHGPLDTKVQPLLRKLKQVRDNLPF